MSEEKKVGNDVSNALARYCILRYENHFTQTFRGMILPSREVIGKDGFRSNVCQVPDGFPTGWRVVGSFYAVNPSFRPLPSGMKIFCVKQARSAPYGTVDIKFVYDMFREETDCDYFITYNLPVQGTKPLYFHRINNSVFPSFDSKPPSVARGWEQTLISPVFVIDDESTLSFIPKNGVCSPSSDGMGLNECVSNYNDSVNFEDENDVLEIVEKMTRDEERYKVVRIIQDTSWYVFAAVALLLLVFTLLVARGLSKQSSAGRRGHCG